MSVQVLLPVQYAGALACFCSTINCTAKFLFDCNGIKSEPIIHWGRIQSTCKRNEKGQFRTSIVPMWCFFIYVFCFVFFFSTICDNTIAAIEFNQHAGVQDF